MNIFDSIRLPKIKRNTFNLTHEFKFSGCFGRLMPIMCTEVLPKDTFSVSSELFVRMAPMIAPIMHRIDTYIHFFFVPNRLIWSEWEDFITGGKDGTAAPVPPYFYHYTEEGVYNLSSYCGVGSLADMLGVPPIIYSGGDPQQFSFSSLPFRAYWQIMKDYYVDNNLTSLPDLPLTSGMESLNSRWLFDFCNRCYEKDYFTSSLPWAQRGDAVELPLSGTAPVNFNDSTLQPSKLHSSEGIHSSTWIGLDAIHDSGDPNTTYRLYDGDGHGLMVDNSANLEVDLSSASSATINELRRAIKAQEWLERSARGGSRYIEQILSHFGVRSSDARLQRAQYLGGGKSPLRVSEVLQTSSTDESSPQGNMAGHGYSVGQSNSFKHFFEEHGFVIGLLSIMPRSTYQQGISRMFTRQDKYDYYWPEFAHLGEQEVKQKEIYCDMLDSNSHDDDVFGYQSRYAEYKTLPSRVAGPFRDTLNFWHAGRIFGSRPTLDESFVECSPDQFTRLFATADLGINEQFYIQVLNKVIAKRPMPKFSTPSF